MRTEDFDELKGLDKSLLFCVTAGGTISYEEMMEQRIQKIRIVADDDKELKTSHQEIRKGIDLAIRLHKMQEEK